MRRRALLFWLGLGIGCAGGPASRPGPAAPEDPLLGIVPAGADVLVEIDAARLRGWSTTQRLLGLLPRDRVQALATGLGFDWLADVDRIVLAAQRRPDASDLLVLCDGRFDPARLRAAAAAHEGSREGEYRGVPIFEAPLTGALLGGRVYLLGPLARVRGAIDVVRAGAPGVRGDEELMRLWTSAGVGEHTLLRAASQHREWVRDRWERDLGLKVDVQATVLRVDGGEGLDLTWTSIFAQPSQAAQGADELRTELEELRRRLAPVGLARPLEGLVIAQQGTRTIGTLRIDQEELDRLLTRLLPVLPALLGEATP